MFCSYQPGPLINLALEFFGRRDVRALEQLSQQDIRRLRSHLKGVNIWVRTGQRSDGPQRRGRPIKDIEPRAGEYQFEKDGVTITVEVRCTHTYPCPHSTLTRPTQAHYQQAWNIHLQLPRVFGVRIGRDAIIPAELCEVVPGQLYKKKIPADMGATFLKFATQKPDVRLRLIQDAVSGRVGCPARRVEPQYPEGGLCRTRYSTTRPPTLCVRLACPSTRPRSPSTAGASTFPASSMGAGQRCVALIYHY